MKYLNRLLVLTAMFLPMSVWAQGAVTKQYLNLYYKSKELYIGLYKKNCVAGNSFEEGTCVKSYEIKPAQTVRSAFVNAISQQWISGTPDATKMQSIKLNLATDIDFGYTFENGSCSENFDFLPFSGLSFNGHNHMMSNFCCIDNGQTKRYLGLFGEVVGNQTNGNKTIRDLIISNVYFAVTSGEPALTSGGDYQPAGALAARISNSTVTNVKLKDVVIQAPLAGGLAGFIEGSTITKVSTIDNSFIKVTNGISITEDYIGKAIYKYGENVAVFDPYKVLLGGLAGAAYFTNFEDIDLAVQVENKAAVDMSALGGLVGHYVYAPKSNQFSQVTNRDSKITEVNIHGSSSDVGVNAFISGGTAMGGILGASRRLDNNNSPITEFSISQSTVTNLDIKQSRFKISDVDATQKLYLGGVVGNADLCNGGILKIIESNVVNANIEESIQESGNFQYYMGGIAGFASCDHVNNSGNRNDLYLTLQKSNASGNIKLDGGYSKTGKTSLSVRTSAAMGGLVGDAIVSLDEGGISENESKVSISYKAKRSASDDLDSVLVGGVFGTVSLFNSAIDYVRLAKLSYKGLLDINDDGINARVGGIVGKFPMIQSGNSKIEFSNVQVKGDSEKDNNIVSYSGETKSSSTSSSIGGICGMCLSPREISKSSVDGNFKGSSGTDAPKKDFHVGGLIGTVDAKADIDIIKNNYFIGSIENKLNKSGSKGKAGYLFGHLTGDGLGNKPKIISNFHYGSDNVKAIGYFYNYGEYNNVMYFNEIQNGVTFDKFVAKNNVRNGSAMDLQNGENGSSMNGTVTESYMKSETFAGFLNSPWDEDEQVWSFDDTHDYPFLGTTYVSPKVQVVFKDAAGNKTQNVKIGDAAVVPENVELKSEGKCLTGWNPADFTNVVAPMTITAIYGDCPIEKFTVKFYDIGGNLIEGSEQEVLDGKAAVPPADPSPKDGLCFDGWNTDFSVVKGNLQVKPNTKKCAYTVKFYDIRGFVIEGSEQEVLYGEAAVAPADPLQTDDLCFIGWDTDFSKVKGNLEVKPNTKKCVFKVNFYGLDGTTVIKTQNVQEGLPARAPTTPEQLGDLCFDGWDTDFSEVKGDLEVKANTRKCVFKVNFYGLDGTTIINTQNVQEGLPASAPDSPEPLGDLCFDGWNTDFSEVKGDLEVKANTKACPNSSSSNQQSSSSSSISSSSSSSENASESSSSSSVENGDKSSSSSAGNGSSSSAVNDKSSSSASDIFTVVAKPTAKQDGSALRMTINDTLPDSHAKVDYHIIVKSDVGTYLDTVVDGKTVGDVKNGTWSLDPAPAGEYKVLITLTNGKDSIVAYDSIFVGSTEKRVDLVSNTWQTYSLYAFCNDKGENCKNDLKDRFARKAEIRAIEECRQMKEDLARSPDDADLRESVDEVCREAIESQNEVATSVFWWDESSPIGDYWQYRRYDADDKFDSTRGYWYGSVDDEPLMLSLQTPNMKDEIVWKLENKYTGWNLVANPYGWYVKLPQNDDVVFKKWKADISDYDTVSILGPYEAVWAYTSKTREYRIPLKAAIVLEGEKKTKSLSKSAMSESWNLRVVLTDKNGKRDYWNELAAGSVASSLSEPPAGMGDRVNLSIVEGKQRLAKSVKKNSDELEWNLEASATTTRDGKLNFEGLESVRAKGMHVFATIGEETFEVVNDRPLNVKLSSKAKNVSVRVTKSAVPAQVAKNLISGFRVNQMQNALNVGFEGVSNLAGAKVKVSVVGIDGRMVATSGTVAHEGTNSISMKKPKQGVYFVRLKVGSQSAVTRIMVR
ncbi:T9SS type A sorting domain-containing protein [Fibrobacter sp. UWB11]|uniref:T9SS type A sorting domain-containing protein n=1 Tax=Fibrobacter sp. UWB11 TaxID=1896202 RepID=UPI00092C8C9D|nr:T9SS type A sorting domain-containing protein [Fibrobacter sp. UWB11]SIO44060.1 Por secretion system C-terminal sorting domain-containing protein [Fibrobacter sp. UWB11]